MIIQRTVIDPIVGTAILVGEGLPNETDAPTGSLFVRKDGGSNRMVYVKFGNNASDWELLASGSGGGTAVSSSYALTSSFSTTATSASNALTSSFATTASFALNAGLKNKSGNINSGSFAGIPLTASVTFTSAFANTNYGVVVTGEDARSWTIQNKATTGFIVNTNSKVGLSGITYWIATAYGES